MRHHKLQAAQSAACGGFTDIFIVTHADLTQSTNNTDETETLDAVEFGDLVFYDVLMEILTPFTPAPSGDAGVNVTLGVTGAVTQFLGNSAIMAAGAATAAKTGYATAAGGAPYVVPTGGKDILATFDITDADGNLAAYTAGEIAILMKILRWNELLGLAQM